MNWASRCWQHVSILTVMGLSATSGHGCSDSSGHLEPGPLVQVIGIPSARVETRVVLGSRDRWSVTTSGLDTCDLIHYETGCFDADLSASFDSELERLISLTTTLNIEDALGALHEAEHRSLGIGLMDDEVRGRLGLEIDERWRLLPPDSGHDNALAEAIRELIDEAYAEAMASTVDPDCQP